MRYFRWVDCVIVVVLHFFGNIWMNENRPPFFCIVYVVLLLYFPFSSSSSSTLFFDLRYSMATRTHTNTCINTLCLYMFSWAIIRRLDFRLKHVPPFRWELSEFSLNCVQIMATAAVLKLWYFDKNPNFSITWKSIQSHGGRYEHLMKLKCSNWYGI